MNEPLSPQVIETLAAGYVVGNLDPSELEAFEQLLIEKPELIEKVDQLQATLDQVTFNLNSVTPPPHLRAAILSAATAPPQTLQHRRSRFLWRAVMGSVAALLILYLGFENYQLRQNGIIAQDIKTLLQQPQTQLFALKAVNATDLSMGSFVVNLGQRQGILSVQNLADLPAGKVYRLWAIADGETIPCGTLKINSQGQVLNKFWMPADFYDTGISGLFITLESSETSRDPTGVIVMKSRSSTEI